MIRQYHHFKYALSFLFIFLLIISPLPGRAQPSWVKKATKSVFTVKTFKADGTLLGSATGFFTKADGVGVSSYETFRGAQRAIVIDAQGKEWPVECILGANATYDLVKFRVQTKKVQPLTIGQKLTEGDVAYLLPYRETKRVTQAKVTKTETFNGTYEYYTLGIPTPENSIGMPVIDALGNVVAIMQEANPSDVSQSYAVSARFADSLAISGLSINDPSLRAIGIKKALPEQLSQALLAIYVASSSADSVTYAAMVDDFIAKFPDQPDGYVYRAQLRTGVFDFSSADADMEKALSLSQKKDETHYSYSRLIYQKLLYQPQPEYAPWTFDKALAEVEAAYAVNPLPVYRHQQAYVLYAQQRYQEADALYAQLLTTNLRSAELLSEAAKCKAMVGDTLAQLALLDSALACFSRPYLREAAPYIYTRATARMEAGRYREAALDLIEYEQLVKMQLSHQFYYLRYQACQGGRLFQQALDDIDRAIALQPGNELYLAEKASLLIRVGMNAEAVATAKQCVTQSPQYADGFLFLGYAQCLSGSTAEGLVNLKKAVELGNEQAAKLIEKYSK